MDAEKEFERIKEYINERVLGGTLSHKYMKTLIRIIEDLNKRNKQDSEKIKELQEINNLYNDMKHLMDNEILGYMEGYRAGKNNYSGIAKICENYEKYILNSEKEYYKKAYIEIRKKLDDSIPLSELEKLHNDFIIVRNEIIREQDKFNRPMMTYDLVRNDYCESMIYSLIKKYKEDK